MPIDPEAFFVAPQGAAILKLALVGKQLVPWASKVGSSVLGGRVAYLDTHAGAGAYANEMPGSPLRAARASAELAHWKKTRRLECFYAESNPVIAKRLRQELTKIEHPHEVFERPIQDCIDEIVGRLGGVPLFVFSDPFGLGLDFSTFSAKLMRRPEPTDIMLNFSLQALRRCAGMLDSNAKTDRALKQRAAVIYRIDAALGGTWWQETWRAPYESTQHRDRAVILEYVKRLRAAGGGQWGWAAIPVSDRIGGAPEYYLVFLSAHPDGLWLLANNLSKGLEEFEDWCEQNERPEGAQLALELDWKSARAEGAKRMQATIAANVDRLLGEGNELVVGRDLMEICGECFGRAREMHIRAALKELHAAARIADAPKGDLQHFRIRR